MKIVHFCAAVAVSGLFAVAAGAVPLAPGGTILPTGTTSAANPALAGVVINDNLIPFSIDPNPDTPLTSVGGNVQNRVARSNDTGNLIFAPRIRDTFNTATSEFNITGFVLEGFGSWTLDVDFRTDGLGDRGPTSVSRNTGDGGILTFRYSGPPGGGDPLRIDALVQEESLFPSILTNAPSFALTGRMIIFGEDPSGTGETLFVSIDGIAVPASIPLPLPGVLLLSGLLGLGWLGRRRRG